MARNFYVSGFKGEDRWVDHAIEVAQKGVIRDGADCTPTEARVFEGSERRQARVAHKDAAIGLDSEDVHYRGDRAVVVAEIPEGDGRVIQYIERYSDSGHRLGSYAVEWEKTGPRTHAIKGSRRIFT